MKDAYRPQLFDEAGNGLGISQVALPPVDAVIKAGSVSPGYAMDDGTKFREAPAQVRADEATCAGDEDGLSLELRLQLHPRLRGRGHVKQALVRQSIRGRLNLRKRHLCLLSDLQKRVIAIGEI